MYWIELNKKNLHHNIQIYHNITSTDNKIAAVIKSNAYGHGIIEIGQELEKNSFVETLCVVNTQEGIKLREHGITKHIFIIGIINSDLADVVKHNLQPTIYNLNIAKQLDQIAQQQNKIITVHIKVDTGLSRMGVLPEELPHYIDTLSTYKNLRIGSIFSHLAKAYDPQASRTQEEKLFIHKHNIPTHIGASKAQPASLNPNHILTRVGIGIYGYVPKQPKLAKMLQPVLSLKSKVVLIKTIPAETPVGYNETFITKRKTTIAILPIGHGDGINLGLSNKAHVIICNKLAPVIGTISMNYITVDVTDIPECTLHDLAILIGSSKDQTISLYDWAELTGLTPTHLATNLKPHIPRILV